MTQATDIFGDRAELAQRYSQLLATEAIERGLIGPREADRVWERHIVNAAAIAPLLGEGVSVVDVGSGAGLPGVVLALARPDIEVVLLEPLLRRVVFLDLVVDQLDLGDQIRVVRGRAEQPRGWQPRDGFGIDTQFDVVTCRAVANLDKLLDWCLPLVRPGGELLAIKGERGEQELQQCQRRLDRLGWSGDVLHVRASSDADNTFAVRIRQVS